MLPPHYRSPVAFISSANPEEVGTVPLALRGAHPLKTVAAVHWFIAKQAFLLVKLLLAGAKNKFLTTDTTLNRLIFEHAATTSKESAPGIISVCSKQATCRLCARPRYIGAWSSVRPEYTISASLARTNLYNSACSPCMTYNSRQKITLYAQEVS